MTSKLPSSGVAANKGRISTRTSERALAQQAFVSDPKYKKYTQQVEKCLNSFDNVHEWADCIAFLKQLLKTFQSYMQFKEIPRKLVVAKRLAQCLNPALPTGVHQRALEVYSHILAILGADGLNRDLALWSSGLFPFFAYAATSVKPTLLNLYDTHYLPLQANLRPLMKSFILALLPGLEEETGEFFEKVLSLLDRLSSAVSPSFFFQNIWLVMLTTSSARGTALNFLSRRLPNLNASDDVSLIVGRDIGLMIRAFSAALEDENLLVRRGALDLLIQSLRMGSAAVKMAPSDDRLILMRAATGVVLRRDLSLNRRLYTWLLGSDEKSDHQVTYFRENALELLVSTLKQEMFSPSGDYSESRPFKIFISLLDKWEIGASLTEGLVYDAFKAIQQLAESKSETGDDILMTASTLYEAVEPHIFWKHFFSSIASEVTGDGTSCEAIRLSLFVLRTFSHQEEEIQTVHLPIVFTALVDVFHLHLRDDFSKAFHCPVLELLCLLEEILQQIPRHGLLQRPLEAPQETQAGGFCQSPYAYACTFYGLSPPSVTLDGCSAVDIPFTSAFNHIVNLSMSCARNMLRSSDVASLLRGMFAHLLIILGELVGRLDSPVLVSWNPSEWLQETLNCIELENASFILVDRIITLAVALHQSTDLGPKLSIDDRSVMFTIVNKLLKYLRPDYAPYHVRVVTLIWSLEASVKGSHVESILSQTMTSPETHNVQESYEAFGVLWRLTEDSVLPGFRLRIPMLIVLDTLKHENPSLRRVAETWMRCNLKSYLRILDPILYELVDPSMRRMPTTISVRGKELQGFLYERPFNQRYVLHMLELLLSVVRFGGIGFAKTIRTAPVQRSLHSGLIRRLKAVGFSELELTYSDVAVNLLLRYLQSEPKDELLTNMQPLNFAIQSTSVDLLQGIIARGEIDKLSVDTVEAAIISKLFLGIHTKRLDLQNKLLHLLHALLSSSVSDDDTPTGRTVAGQSRPSVGAFEDEQVQSTSQEFTSRTHDVNPLLIQTLVDGVVTPSNLPILQHWLDFILMAVAQFQPTLHSAIPPLIDCICRQLLLALSDVRRASLKDAADSEDVLSIATDSEMIMLLNALERLIGLSLAHASDTSQSEEENLFSDKAAQESSGLLSYVSTVFSSDNAANTTEDQLSARSPGYRALHDGVRVLFVMWGSLVWSDPPTRSPKDESLCLIYNRTRLRCRRALEHIFHAHSGEVFESIVDCWDRELPDMKAHDGATFELVDVLISSSYDTVNMICESISCRVAGIPDKSKKQAINPNLSDATLFRFLEQYLRRLEGPLAVQVWGRFIQLVKDISSGRDLKAQTFSALRCLATIAEKITQTTAMEDRRIRKELQENFGKLLDTCVAHIGRSADQGSWIRRSAKETLNANGRESPIPREPKLDDNKANASTTSLHDSLKPAAGADLVLQFIASTALPNLRRFLMETDKIAAACTNIVYYIVNPSMKGKSRPMDVEDSIVDIIRELSKIPAALKAWRAPIADLLNDNRLFNCSADAPAKWRPIIKALFDADKSAFADVLAKIVTAPSANIFTNREYEMLLRSLNVRRLSFVIFSGDKNQFITQLPNIQERLVDILRNITAPMVQSEVYLCIRVLLCRLSPHNLTSFWPVILTELYRLFEQTMTVLPSDGSEDLQLILAASKCLDLLLVLQTEEFQIHQWIFITDTVDAIYRPEDQPPEAILDQLADIAGSLPVAEGSREASSVNNGIADFDLHTSSNESRPMRRPLLNFIRQIESIRDLVPFFSQISVTSYESVYASGGNIDWEAVERGLMDDMFDGR